MATQPKGWRSKNRKRPTVLHPDTEEIVEGLFFHESSGRFYRLIPKDKSKGKQGTTQRHYYPKFGLKGEGYKRRAVFDHLRFLKKEGPSSSITIGYKLPSRDIKAFAEDFETALKRGETVVTGSKGELTGATAYQFVNRESALRWFREQLLNPETRYGFAQEMGVPELAYFDRWVPPASLTLDQCLKEWQDKKRKRAKGQDWTDKAIGFYEEFKRAVGVETLAQLNREHIKAYADMVLSVRTSKDYSSSYSDNRFIAVASILRAAEKINAQEVARINAFLKEQFVTDVDENEDDYDPTPISKEAFSSILSSAKKNKDDLFITACLISLNGAYYPKDLSWLRASDISLEDATIMNKRSKTLVARVCVLWDESIESIKNYLKSSTFKHWKEAQESTLDKSPMNPFLRKIKELSTKIDALKETLKTSESKELTKELRKLERSLKSMREQLKRGTLFPFVSQRFRKTFNKYRADESVKFRDIRDASFTIAASSAMSGDKGNLDVARVIGGHKLGDKDSSTSIDAYYLRNAKDVKAACMKIREEMGIEKLWKSLKKS